MKNFYLLIAILIPCTLITGKANVWATDKPDKTNIGTEKVRKSAAVTMNVDFEEALNETNYPGWTFTNLGNGIAITGHNNSSSYGRNVSTKEAYVKTKNKVNPLSLTCYVSKTTKNSNASTWTIQISANDNNDWIDVNSVSVSDIDIGKWIELSADLRNYTNVYVRVYYYGSTESRAIDDLTLSVLASGDASYSRTTSVVPGRHYIITNGTDKAMGVQDENNRSAASISVTDGSTIIAPAEGVEEFVMGVDPATGFFTLYDASGSSYLSAASSENDWLGSNSELDANGKWTVAIDAEGVATVKAQGTNTHNILCFDNTNDIFSCYASGESNVYLFEKDGDSGSQSVTATISAACTDGTNCYGTYSAPFAFTVPADVTVSEIAVADGTLRVEAYDAGAVVPAHTGVMISSATAEEKTFTTAKGGISVLGAANTLRPTLWGISSAEMVTADANSLYYRLTMHDGTKIGYWWGAAEGASFNYATPYRAYMVVPTAGSSARQGFAFSDIPAAISDVDVQPVANDRCFDLQGRSVACPQKGIYIVNGKKKLVK